MNTLTEIEVGKVYQSRSFAHIKRKVVRVKDGIVTYSILRTDRNDPFNKVCTAVENEFKKISEAV